MSTSEVVTYPLPRFVAGHSDCTIGYIQCGHKELLTHLFFPQGVGASVGTPRAPNQGSLAAPRRYIVSEKHLLLSVGAQSPILPINGKALLLCNNIATEIPAFALGRLFRQAILNYFAL